MDQTRFLIDTVIIEKRSIRSVAHDYVVSKSWVHKLVTLYNHGGYDPLQPRSKRPLTSPNQTTLTVRDEIIRLRKTLAEDGLENGSHTIAWQLTRSGFKFGQPHRDFPSWRESNGKDARSSRCQEGAISLRGNFHRPAARSPLRSDA